MATVDYGWEPVDNKDIKVHVVSLREEIPCLPRVRKEGCLHEAWKLEE